jgi:hypothetical protein
MIDVSNIRHHNLSQYVTEYLLEGEQNAKVTELCKKYRYGTVTGRETNELIKELNLFFFPENK